MFPETYGRTLEELAFLFEDRALADEATKKVEKQMELSGEQRWSRLDDRVSWDMDIVNPIKFDGRGDDSNYKGLGGRKNNRSTSIGKEIDAVKGCHRQAIRGETGRWWDN
jgi:hypothetical protein